MTPTRIIQSYHLFAGLLGLAASLSLYGLLAQIFTRKRLRRLAFALAFLGSGAGWLQLVVGYLPSAEISPIDFWLIDAYPFFGLLVLPHFMLLLTLMALQWGAFLIHLRRPSRRALALAVLAGVIMQTISPLAPALAGIALFGSWLCAAPRAWRSRVRPPGTGALLLIGVTQLPGLSYTRILRHPIKEGKMEIRESSFFAKNGAIQADFSSFLCQNRHVRAHW